MFKVSSNQPGAVARPAEQPERSGTIVAGRPGSPLAVALKCCGPVSAEIRTEARAGSDAEALRNWRVQGWQDMLERLGALEGVPLSPQARQRLEVLRRDTETRMQAPGPGVLDVAGNLLAVRNVHA